MRIVDELKTKKDFEHDKLEIFNKWWYNQGYEKFKNCIKDNMYLSDDKVFKCHDAILINYASEITYNKNALELRFIRSKLWNEGINLKLTLDGIIIFSIKNSKDKYNDCFDLSNIQSLEFVPSNVDKIFLAEFADISISQIENLIKNIFEQSKNTINDKIKKNKKSKKRKDKPVVDDNTKLFAIDYANTPVDLDCLEEYND